MLIGAVLLIAVAVSGGRSDGGGRNLSPSEAYCKDLRDGATVMNLWDREQDPQDYADDAYGRMSISCSEQLERFRGYFEEWGINIDA